MTINPADYLTEYVKAVSEEDFGLPFQHEAIWNRRLKTTGGRFFPKTGHLDFNPHLYQQMGETVFRKIVRHELCHYHLYFQGKGYRHKDKDFKDLLKAVDGLRYAPTQRAAKAYHYRCQSCQQDYHRSRRVNVNRFVCGRCRGRLTLLGS